MRSRLSICVLVVDTGSTDGTQEVIQRSLRQTGISGQVIDEPWRDFGYNRSLALTEPLKHPDNNYALINEADDLIVFEDGFDAAVFKRGMRCAIWHVASKTDELLTSIQ